MTVLLLVLLGLDTAALAGVWILYRKAKKAGKSRRVEGPNSQFKSPYVQDLETRERWESIDLDRLHEVNREEVVKTLGKVRALGVRGLSATDRAFLDRIAAAEDRTAGTTRPPVTRGRPTELPRPS